MALRALGVVVIVVGVMILGVSFVGFGSGSGGDGNRVCDVIIVVRGTVTDTNLIKTVGDWDFDSVSGTNCHQYGIGDTFADFWRKITGSQAALIGVGTVEIHGNAYLNSEMLRESSHFTVTTQHLQVTKSFSAQIVFKSLPSNTDIDIQMFTSWGEDTPQFVERIRFQ